MITDNVDLLVHSFLIRAFVASTFPGGVEGVLKSLIYTKFFTLTHLL